MAPEVPIVVLSGRDDEELALEAVHTGAQDYLVKGRADAELLRRTIRYAIERRRAERHRIELVSAQRDRIAAEDRAERLRRLQRITDATIESVTADELLASVAEAVGEVLSADWVTLVAEARGLDAGPPRVDFAPGDDLPIAAATKAASTLVARAREQQLPLTGYLDASGTVSEQPTPDMLAAGIAVPLGTTENPAGALVALRRRNAFLHDEIDLAQLVAERVAVALERARLYEREHTVATALQRSLLPEALPDVAGARIAVRYRPAGWGLEAGGDWYDVVEQPDGRRAFVVGDVVGRGVPAAAMMGQLRHALRAYLVEGHAPAAALAQLDALVESSGPGTLATVACAAYDPATGKLEYASAGHPPPLVVPPHGPARFLEYPLGMPVGVLPDAEFQSRTTTLAPGSLLLLFTDGLVETAQRDISLGMDKLAGLGERLFQQGFEGGARMLIDSMEQTNDDRALILVHRRWATAHER